MKAILNRPLIARVLAWPVLTRSVHTVALTPPSITLAFALLTGLTASFVPPDGAARGRIVYVATTGDDALGNGSGGRPYRTPARALRDVSPGDTVQLAAGTYAPFAITESGEANRRLTVRAAPGREHQVIVDGSGTSVRGVIAAHGQSHLVIEGFRIINAPTDGITILGKPDGARDIIIRHNQISTTGNAGIYCAGLIMGQTIPVDEYRLFDLVIEDNDVTNTNFSDGGNECISVGGGLDGFVIRRNIVHDSEQYGIDAKFGTRNGLIEQNTIFNMEKHGIYLDTNSRTIEYVTVRGNRVWGCGGNGITLAREAQRDDNPPVMRFITIENNVVHDNLRGLLAYRHREDGDDGEFRHIIVRHNTLYRNNGGDGSKGSNQGFRLIGLSEAVDKSSWILANNISFGHTNGDYVNNAFPDIIEAGNLLGEDPVFEAPQASSPDFRLAANSPAVDGADVSDTSYTTPQDITGTVRTTADVGAYERVADGAQTGNLPASARPVAEQKSVSYPGANRERIRVFPNPAHRQLSVTSAIDLKQARMRLLNPSGQSLLSFEVHQPTRQHTIDVSDIPPGLYFLRIRSPGAPPTDFKVILE